MIPTVGGRVMKKLFVIFTLAALLVFAISGCGQKMTPEQAKADEVQAMKIYKDAKVGDLMVFNHNAYVVCHSDTTGRGQIRIRPLLRGSDAGFGICAYKELYMLHGRPDAPNIKVGSAEWIEVVKSYII